MPAFLFHSTSTYSTPSLNDQGLAHNEGQPNATVEDDFQPFPSLSQPPPLDRKRHIPLPVLTNQTSTLNGLLMSSWEEKAHIQWDITQRPGEAQFAGIKSDDTMARRDVFWGNATCPPTNEYIKIRIGANFAFLDITVTPSGPLTILDVLNAVYQGVREEALKRWRSGKFEGGDVPPRPPFALMRDGRSQDETKLAESEVPRIIRAHMQGMTRWAGLHKPHRDEGGVWLLKIAPAQKMM
ncbi:hypothetical protein JR316_0008656 [Psilocybe cubensis]|uniref:Uncharacterized protein n=2 Tax=Psilocybe cubensis TaxID=181762 RepID=A0ACB8GR29_PSICU|nr:hypothetical protein JR316_0008656 [Psilocybe cubensis]KAH9478203.1 hypothetical protein JR316_0008656 [Psilocybe cubensis]